MDSSCKYLYFLSYPWNSEINLLAFVTSPTVTVGLATKVAILNKIVPTVCHSLSTQE